MFQVTKIEEVNMIVKLVFIVSDFKSVIEMEYFQAGYKYIINLNQRLKAIKLSLELQSLRQLSCYVDDIIKVQLFKKIAVLKLFSDLA